MLTIKRSLRNTMPTAINILIVLSGFMFYSQHNYIPSKQKYSYTVDCLKQHWNCIISIRANHCFSNQVTIFTYPPFQYSQFLKSFKACWSSSVVLALAIRRNLQSIISFTILAPFLVAFNHLSHACSLWKSQIRTWQSRKILDKLNVQIFACIKFEPKKFFSHAWVFAHQG